MVSMDEPYFMTNKAWYYHDEEEWIYKLTDEAPEEARHSYEEFYATLNGSYYIDGELD